MAQADGKPAPDPQGMGSEATDPVDGRAAPPTAATVQVAATGEDARETAVRLAAGSAKMNVRAVSASVTWLTCDVGAAEAVAMSARDYAFWWGCHIAPDCAGSRCSEKLGPAAVECPRCRCARFCSAGCASGSEGHEGCDRLLAAVQKDGIGMVAYMRTHASVLRARRTAMPPPEMDLLIVSIDAVAPADVLCLAGECDDVEGACPHAAAAAARPKPAQVREVDRVRLIATHFASLQYAGDVVHPVYVALCNQTLGDVAAMPLSSFARLSCDASADSVLAKRHDQSRSRKGMKKRR